MRSLIHDLVQSKLSELRRLVVPFPAFAMKSYHVSQQVKHAQVEDQKLVEPIELSLAGTNLSLF